MRLFIAINLDEPMRASLAAIQEGFKDFGKIKFPKAEQLHLTMKFLGEADPDHVKTALEGISFPPFPLVLSHIGIFDEKYVRVLWISFKESTELKELKRKIDAVLLQYKDDHPFSPHITLARVVMLPDKKAFLDKVKSVKVEQLKTDVTHFSLMKSELLLTGPKYMTLAAYSASTYF